VQQSQIDWTWSPCRSAHGPRRATVPHAQLQSVQLLSVLPERNPPPVPMPTSMRSPASGIMPASILAVAHAPCATGPSGGASSGTPPSGLLPITGHRCVRPIGPDQRQCVDGRRARRPRSRSPRRGGANMTAPPARAPSWPSPRGRLASARRRSKYGVEPGLPRAHPYDDKPQIPLRIPGTNAPMRYKRKGSPRRRARQDPRRNQPTRCSMTRSPWSGLDRAGRAEARSPSTPRTIGTWSSR
jgi:hypothetical protein